MTDAECPRAIVTTLSVLPDQAQSWADWQAAFCRAAQARPGFVSIETIPVAGDIGEWHVIQRFATAGDLDAWSVSPARAAALRDFESLRAPGRAAPADAAAPDFHGISAVTEVITTTVAPGREAAFHDWAAAMQAAQARFPGYLGTLIQAPVAAALPFWTTLVRFASPAQLDNWLASPERAARLAVADPTVSSWRSHRLSSPFAGWFPSGPETAAPPAWKQTALVLLVLFPVVMLEVRFLSPLLAALPMALATFIGNAISVAAVSWVLMRVAVLCLGWWLNPGQGARRQRMELAGAATLVLLYAIEILFFTFIL
jgi:antibiotic biosynthesis monooxygenase (ABM) superfamily enzyme